MTIHPSLEPIASVRSHAPAFRCRSCASSHVSVFLSLGESPLANGIIRSGQESGEQRFSLDVGFCQSCALVQLTFAPPPEALFRDYPYFSSFSDTMVAHAQELSRGLIQDRSLTSDSLVIELASNDGYLLQFYRDAGIPVLGIEPALNIASVAQERGIETISDFFDSTLASDLVSAGRRADVIHAHNVLAHVPDLNGFVDGIAQVLKSEGIAVIEVPYLGDLIDHTEFDTIYHEHLSYFSLTSLDRLFSSHGLTIFDIVRERIHGGTLRIYAGRSETYRERSAAMRALLATERDRGMTHEGFYRDFGGRVSTLKNSLLGLLSQLKSSGQSIAGYGASAKGTTLLTYCGIGRNLLDFLVDRSTVKQGYLAPGSHLPIYSPDYLLREMPDFTLLLVWNFAEEVLAQQTEYRSRGGRFIIPIPFPQIV